MTIKEKVKEAIDNVGNSPSEIKKYISEKYPETNPASVGYELWKMNCR